MKSIIITATAYLVIFGAYIKEMPQIAANFRDFQEILDVGPRTGLILILSPLVLVTIKQTITYMKRKLNIVKVRGGPSAGWFRIQPYIYTKNDAERYATKTRLDGIEKEIWDWLITTKFPLVYVTGKSGVGKTSIIQAYLMPKANLSELSNFEIIYLRVLNDFISELQESLELKVNLSYSKDTGRFSFSENTDAKKMIILIIDQFEEILIDESRRDLDEFIKFITSDQNNNIKVALVLRDDYLPTLEEHLDWLPSLRLMENWRQIPPFNRNMASKFFVNSGVKLDEHVVRKLLDYSSDFENIRGQYRPIVLNMMGIALENITYKGRYILSISKENPLKTYLKDLIDSVHLSQDVLDTLISDNATRKRLSVSGIVSLISVPPREVRKCIRELEVLGLVKKVDEKSDLWEVSHDFIAKQCFQIITPKKFSYRKLLKHSFPVASILIAIMLMIPINNSSMVRESIISLSELDINVIEINKEHIEIEIPTLYEENYPLEDLQTLIDKYESYSLRLTGYNYIHESLLSSEKLFLLEINSDLADNSVKFKLELPITSGVKHIHLLRTSITELNITKIPNGQLKGLTLTGNLDLKEFVGAESHLRSLESLELLGNKRLNIDYKFISSLEELVALNVSDNGNSIYLPDDLSKLTKIRYIEIYGEEFESFPPSFYKLDTLTHLKIAGRKFSELSDDINNFHFLEVLELSSSPQLRKIPDEIGRLSNLKRLSFDYLGLESLPESIGELKNLQSLHLNIDGLTRLPDSIGDLSKLNELTVSCRSLVELPSSIGGLGNLKYLELSSGRYDLLPDSIGDMDNLLQLEISNLDITGIPESIGNLTNLRVIDIYQTPLFFLPKSITKLKSLVYLRLQLAHNLRSVPDDIGELSSLEFLSINVNQFIKYLPNSIGDLSNLKVLSINIDSLRGIPSSISQLDNLVYLELTTNQDIFENYMFIADINNLEYVYFGNRNVPIKIKNWIASKNIGIGHRDEFVLDYHNKIFGINSWRYDDDVFYSILGY